jgi:hypothetical protein
MGTDFNTILEDFKKGFITTSFSFIIPKGYVGMRIRMRLSESAGADEVFFEADFKRTETDVFLGRGKDVYILENIVASEGLSFQIPSDGVIEMAEESYDENSNTVPFTISGLNYDGAPYSVDRELVSQLFYDGGKLRVNSEYASSSNRKKNAYVLLVMDTSTSFATQLDAAKDTARQIILYISEQM